MAHPDDETLGVGAQLGRWESLHLIHLTDGAPRDGVDARRAGYPNREAYAAARARELDAALHELGAVPAVRISLGLVDQEAALHLAMLARQLRTALAGVEVVYTHAFEHGHPDHDAAAFAVHAACALLARDGAEAPPIVEFPLYHLGPAGDIVRARFRDQAEWPVREVELDAAERARKARAVACFHSQAAMLQPFALDVERFRRAPRHDFLRPPSAPGAWYDALDWPLTSDLWREHARRALHELHLHPGDPA
ncbi:MAG: PIG-L family deacetylase [Xanthomonadales bacterium]|nr:PIG-L family deacetylase [Xanthomonadales bacterium]